MTSQVYLMSSPHWYVLLTALPSGKQGCKNIRAGGDSVMVPTNSLDGARFSTYVVYRSFRVPPPIKPLVETIRVRSNPVKWIQKWMLRVFSTRVVFSSCFARGWKKMKSSCARLQVVTLLNGFHVQYDQTTMCWAHLKTSYATLELCPFKIAFIAC